MRLSITKLRLVLQLGEYIYIYTNRLAFYSFCFQNGTYGL